MKYLKWPWTGFVSYDLPVSGTVSILTVTIEKLQSLSDTIKKLNALVTAQGYTNDIPLLAPPLIELRLCYRPTLPSPSFKPYILWVIWQKSKKNAFLLFAIWKHHKQLLPPTQTHYVGSLWVENRQNQYRWRKSHFYL